MNYNPHGEDGTQTITVLLDNHECDCLTITFTEEGIIFDVVEDNEVTSTEVSTYEELINRISGDFLSRFREERNAERLQSIRRHPTSQLFSISDGGGK